MIHCTVPRSYRTCTAGLLRGSEAAPAGLSGHCVGENFRMVVGGMAATAPMELVAGAKARAPS
eukprot:7611517-Alexandrium_andersonii.AAC.1